jgi:hypothetical protein
MYPRVFLGLVTHPQTRFRDSAEPGGLVFSLAELLSQRGVDAVTEVHGANLYSPSLLTLDRAEVRASIAAELTVEMRWRSYLDPTVSAAWLRSFMAARHVYRRLRFAPPWRRALAPSDAGPTMLRRLVNIELAHIALMESAVESGADWALIVEDDAAAVDTAGLASALASFVVSRTDERQPQYVNVSRSFDEASLGIDSCLTMIDTWNDGSGTTIQSAALPVTNTVCAVLYRTTFLQRLLDAFAGIPLSPVLPIDWKLNEAIMRMNMAGELTSGDCWFLIPAPVTQRSMH